MPDTDYTDLNARLAALLFGLRRVNPVDGAENCWTGGSDLTRHNKLCQGLTDYARSWEGAGLVLEAMRARGHIGWLTMHEDSTASASFNERNSDAHIPIVSACESTAPHAIACAALSAIEAANA